MKTAVSNKIKPITMQTNSPCATPAVFTVNSFSTWFVDGLTSLVTKSPVYLIYTRFVYILMRLAYAMALSRNEMPTYNNLCLKIFSKWGVKTTVHYSLVIHVLTHWGRVTHICVIKLIIIGSDNGLSPGRRQAIIWTNAGILLIRPLGTNFNEILIEIHTFSFKKMHLKMSSGKRRPFCLGLNVLTHWVHNKITFSNSFSWMKSITFWFKFYQMRSPQCA